jgi:hypothetical protein
VDFWGDMEKSLSQKSSFLPFRTIRVRAHCHPCNNSTMSSVGHPVDVLQGESELANNFTLSGYFGRVQGTQFGLLWRATCDGFSSSKIHRQYDGHTNTRTEISDTGESILARNSFSFSSGWAAMISMTQAPRGWIQVVKFLSRTEQNLFNYVNQQLPG